MRISDWSSDVCSSDLAEALDDAGGHADEALGLVLVEAGGADDLLELRRLCDREVLRSRVAGEELRRDHLDALVAGLRRQDRGDEHPVGVGVLQRAELDRVAPVLECEPLVGTPGPYTRYPGAAPDTGTGGVRYREPRVPVAGEGPG